MEKDLEKLIDIYEDDEDDVITAPYYFVTYVDHSDRTHIATVKEDWYLHFLEDRYCIKECKFVDIEKVDNFQK